MLNRGTPAGQWSAHARRQRIFPNQLHNQLNGPEGERRALM
jgi:hypothetical protein